MIKLFIILILILISNNAFSDGIIVPNLSSITSIYDASGTNLSSIKMIKGSCSLTLGSCTVNFTNSSIFTSSSSYSCFANDTSGIAAVASAVPQSGSQIKCFGTGSDTIQFSCIGN